MTAQVTQGIHDAGFTGLKTCWWIAWGTISLVAALLQPG
jgi:hypothetical protein